MAWPSTGITTASPMNAGSEPINSSAATIRPQAAIVTGLADTARTEAVIAAAAPTSRSTNSGNDTTLMTNAQTAKPRPIRLPQMISCQPARVVKMSWMNCA